MNLCNKVMVGEKAHLCLLISLALGTVMVDGACERGHSWWHPEQGQCIPCTRCDPRRLAVRYPCELHRDTICQPLYEVRIWPFNTQKDLNDSSNDYEYYEYTDYSEVSDREPDWDLQTSTLTLAISGCIVFFVVVLTLSLYHAKQWRVLKQALKSDVQDLSAKLKLMEAGGEAPSAPAHTDHIYSNIHIAKEDLIGTHAKKGLGNVYTQEKHTP